MQKENREKFFVSEIIASDDVAINYLYEEENTFDRKSMC